MHFNHRSRPEENEQEQSFVKTLAQTFNFNFHVESYQGTHHSEEQWRKARYNFFHTIIEKHILQHHRSPQLWLAHHLDDSWEWSLMQQAKSGNARGSLGIPVRHGAIFRPFLSVSKKQILRYLKSYSLSFVNDSSNLNTHYERNWWRLTVLKKIQKKYPQVLKHYVQRSMELALKYNLLNGQTPLAKFHILDKHTHLFHFQVHQKAQHSVALIKKSLHHLSSHNRMKLYKQLRILFESYKKKKKGPISFSGGVKAYITHNMIILTNKKEFHFSSDILSAELKIYIP